jgi:hypothetical protein
MKILILILTALTFQARANSVDDYTQVAAENIQNKSLIQLQRTADDLIKNKKLSRFEESCGLTISFKGPKGTQNDDNMQAWIKGIAFELENIRQDEDVKLHGNPLLARDIHNKINVLADRNNQYQDYAGVDTLAGMITQEVQTTPSNYYFLSGDYLDGQTGWMAAVVLVNISEGEAVFIGHSSDCR